MRCGWWRPLAVLKQRRHQPTAAALWALLPSTTAVQPHRLYQGESRATIREWGITQIMPERQ